jgi:hypothetical protein
MPFAKQIVIFLDLFKDLSDQKHTKMDIPAQSEPLGV